MSLADTLRQLGGRLGLLRVIAMEEAAGDSGPRKVVTRTITMKELATTVRREQVRRLAEKPAELEVPLAKILAAAGVKPPAGGWTVDRLGEVVDADKFKALGRQAAQKAVLEMLASEKVAVEAIVRNAMAQDQALDAYDAFVRRKMEDRAAARRGRADEIRAQIKDLEQELARQAEDEAAECRHWQAWLARKIAHEESMARALSYLLDVPVVSVTRPEGP